MKWITRERPKIDRIACPWLIARFIDDNIGFHVHVPEDDAERMSPEKAAEMEGRFRTWLAEMDAAEPRGPFKDY